MKAILVAGVLLSLVFAGCTAARPVAIEETEVADRDGRYDTKLDNAADLGVSNGAGVAPNWWFMTTPIGPEAPLRSFEWKVPRESAIENILLFEIAPRIEGEAPEKWTLSVVAADEKGSAELRASYLAAPLEGVVALGPLRTPVKATASISPGLFRFYFSGEAPETLFFILGGEAAEKGELGLGLRVLSEEPEDSYESPEDFEAFKAERTGTPGVLAPSGEGTGLLIALFEDLAFLNAIGIRTSTPDMTVETRLPDAAWPMLTARDDSHSTEIKASSGYSKGIGIGWAEYGATKWAVDVDAHGEAFTARGVTPAIGQPLTWTVTGAPIFAYAAEGTGGGRARFDAQEVTASGDTFNILFFLQISFGSTLSDLTGLKPPNSGSFVYRGLVGDVPPATLTLGPNSIAIDQGTNGRFVIPMPTAYREAYAAAAAGGT